MIVQYNKYEIVEGNFTPFPITMARPHGRVTDENAPGAHPGPRAPRLHHAEPDYGRGLAGLGAGARPVLRRDVGPSVHPAAGDGGPRRGRCVGACWWRATARGCTSTPAWRSSASSRKASPARTVCSRTCWRWARTREVRSARVLSAEWRRGPGSGRKVAGAPRELPGPEPRQTCGGGLRRLGGRAGSGTPPRPPPLA